MKQKSIVIITGASSGLGKEFVIQLNECLKTVDELWVIARSREKLEQLKQVVTNVNLRVVPLDLYVEDDISKLERILKEEQPKVRIFVNCAGVGFSGAFRTLTKKEVCDMILLNVKAFTELTYIVLPYMSNHSHIIQLSSASAFLPQKEFSVYAASKAYVLSFSKALRQEISKQGICVTTVCPGPVDTEFLRICNKGKKALIDVKKGKTLSIYGMPMKFVYFISHFIK